MVYGWNAAGFLCSSINSIPSLEKSITLEEEVAYAKSLRLRIVEILKKNAEAESCPMASFNL